MRGKVWLTVIVLMALTLVVRAGYNGNDKCEACWVNRSDCIEAAGDDEVAQGPYP